MNKNKQRQHIRLALPALCDLTLDTPLAFALLGRDGRVLRAGELPLRELAPSLGNWPVQVALQAGDAVVADVTVPPVPARRLSEVVFSVIEPMVLSNVSQLLLAHGPRRADGSVVVAWGDRTLLVRAWTLLQDAGLQPVSLVPQALVLPADDPQPAQSLALPVGPRWLGDWPDWSLADGLTHTRNGMARWHRPLAWAGLAVAIWVLGLNLYAGQQQGRLDGLSQAMRQTVERAFPQISVVIDPVRQAQQQRDALRLSGGDVTETDFLPLAMAAADVLGFAQGQVRSVQYQDGVLSLDLVSGYQPPASLAALQQAAAVRHILIEHDEAQPQRWRVREGNTEGAKK